MIVILPPKSGLSTQSREWQHSDVILRIGIVLGVIFSLADAETGRSQPIPGGNLPACLPALRPIGPNISTVDTTGVDLLPALNELRQLISDQCPRADAAFAMPGDEHLPELPTRIWLLTEEVLFRVCRPELLSMREGLKLRSTSDDGGV